MLEVDETLTMIWLSRSSKVSIKVRRWPQSPIGTIFAYSFCWNWHRISPFPWWLR